MKRELRLLFTALTFFTRLPGPAFTFQEHEFAHAARYFPLIGILVGAVSAGVYFLANRYFPIEIAVLASMAVGLWLTGAFHEDGLADAVDGLGGSWSQERALAIMQDSRLGSYGAIGLFMALFTKFEAVVHLPPTTVPVALIAGHALSRFGATLVIFTHTYVRPGGKAQPFAARLSAPGLVLAGLFGLLPFGLLEPRMLWALLPVAVVWLWFTRLLQRRIGGYTGDCLGATQQLCELAFYLGLLGLVS